jgi:DNA-binding NarL/FixJ family response regulator
MADQQKEVGSVRVLLIDDHALMREGVALMLRLVDEGVEIQHAATLAQAERGLAGAQPPELVLLDLGLPDAQGMEAVHRVRALAEEAVLVVLSGVEEPATMRECIAAGAMGYIHKSASSSQMMEALRQALAGQVVLPEGVPEPAALAVPAMLQALTRRQREVLACVVA